MTVSVLTLMRRLNRSYSKAGMTVTYALPDVSIGVPQAAGVCESAGQAMLAEIRHNLMTGHDALGAHYQIAGRRGKTPKGDTRINTHKRRLYDQLPPSRSHRKGREVKSGKRKGEKVASKARKLIQEGLAGQTSNRYQKRYPEGGSKGGQTFFVDSGHMVKGLRVEVRREASGSHLFASGGAYATVLVPRDRVAAVLAMEARGIYPIAIVPKVLDQQVNETLNQVIKPFVSTSAAAARSDAAFEAAGFTVLKPDTGRLIGGAVLRGIRQGLGL